MGVDLSRLLNRLKMNDFPFLFLFAGHKLVGREFAKIFLICYAIVGSTAERFVMNILPGLNRFIIDFIDPL